MAETSLKEIDQGRPGAGGRPPSRRGRRYRRHIPRRLRTGALDRWALALPPRRGAISRIGERDDPAAAAVASAAAVARGHGLEQAELAWADRIGERLGRIEAAGGSVPLKGGEPGRSLDLNRVARLTSVGRPWGLLLMRLAHRLGPARCLELGSAYGISSSYLAAGLELAGEGHLTAIDRQPAFVAIARQTHREIGLESRIDLIEAGIDDALPELLSAGPAPGLVYVDDEHLEKTTLARFELLVEAVAPGGVIVYDDVHWSAQMKRSWRQIAADPRLEWSLDLRRFGVCVVGA